MLAGSKFFDAGQHVTHMLISFDKPLHMRFGSVKEKSDVSMLLSLRAEKFFLPFSWALVIELFSEALILAVCLWAVAPLFR